MFNKKKNILLYVLMFIMVFSIDVKRVRGYGDDYRRGASINTAACNYGGCFAGAVGFRITIVNNIGERCAYYNNEIICDSDKLKSISNKYKSKSIDYWFSLDDLSSLKSTENNSAGQGSHCFSYSKKLTKKERLSKFNEYDMDKCIENHSDLYSITYLGFPEPPRNPYGDLKGNYLSKWKRVSYGSNYYDLTRIPENGEKIKDYFENQISVNNYTILNNILSMAFGGRKGYIQSDKLFNAEGKIIMKGLNNAFIEYDQILELGNYDVQQANGGQYQKLTFIGIVSEVAYMYKNLKYNHVNTNWGVNAPFGRYCVQKDANVMYQNELSCDSYAVGAGFFSGWSGSENKLGLSSIYPGFNSNTLSDLKLEQLYKSDTANVFSTWMGDYVSDTCNDDAHQRNSTKPEINNYSYNELIAYLKKNWSEFNNTYNPTKNKMNVLRAVKENNIKSHINNNYFNTNFEDNYCGQITCANILDNMEKNESNLKWLYNIFNYNELLNPETLKSLYEGESNPLSYAQCKPTPECPLGNKVIAKCNSDGAIVFEDNSSLECLSDNNIAYNGYTDESGTFKSGGLQSSKAPAGFGKDSFCWEQVTLTLPKDVANTKAGNLLKWGTDLNDSNVYGTMQITKRCFNVTAESIKLSWLKETATNATLNYKEAILASVPADKYTAQIRKGNVISKINKYGYRTYSTSLNRKSVKDIPMGNYTYPGMDNINKNVSMNSSNSIDVVATYDLVYPDELNWYTNKDKNSSRETISKKELDASTLSNNNNYNYLGYGFPTSFLTPTGLKKNENWNDSVSVSGNDGTGYMYAEITNVGTKNNNNSSYHFDKMIKYAVEDDSNSNAAKTSIIYSCGYSIYNELFGYEDGEECVDCPTPKGIDVVFRTVELINENANIEEQIDRAFPGKAGRGRERGSNWTVNKSTGDNYTNDDIASILSSDVYNNEPMYSISLDSALIQEIRNSNRDIRNTTAPDGTNLDPYTYMGTNEEYGYTKGLIEVPDEDTDESSLKYFYISNWLTNLSRNHHDRFTINNDLENNRNDYSINYAKYNSKKAS